MIGLVPGQIRTSVARRGAAEPRGLRASPTPTRDLAKVVVLERHLETGRVGRGFVRGFGLERGAFGSTVAHDAHNLIVVGVEDEAMLRGRAPPAGARRRDRRRRAPARVLAELPLPVAGLLSDRPLAEVLAASRAVADAVASLGVRFPQPIQTLAFLSLSVIPALKITDRGLVDVERFELVPLAL